MLLERQTVDEAAVRAVLDRVKADGRSALSAPEAKQVADAYGLPVPQEGLATSPDEAAQLAAKIGFPVVLKIVSPDILHKTEAGGVLVGVEDAQAVRAGYDTIVANAKKYLAGAQISGVQVQQMLPTGAQEVIVGAVTDPSFGKLVAFGLGGVLVEVLKDVTFRLARGRRAARTHSRCSTPSRRRKCSPVCAVPSRSTVRRWPRSSRPSRSWSP